MQTQQSLIPNEAPPASAQLDLRPFQDEFMGRAFAPDIRTAALSIPRGNGKSTLSGYILARCMTPGDPLNVPGGEYVLLAGSIGQARYVFQAMKEQLPDPCYRWVDSQMSLGCTDRRNRTRTRVVSSNAKAMLGLVGCTLLVGDEPGAWETRAGEKMWAAIETSQGKPGSDLRVILIGTIAPATRGWWADLVQGGSDHGRGLYVHALQGDLEKWSDDEEIARCNPLMWSYPKSRKVLQQERDAALVDVRAKAQFLSFRLNRPSADESEVLLTVQDWQAVEARTVPERLGLPIVAIDMGQTRSWSSATAIWANGRTESLAVAPGVPSIADQEARDREPVGEYQQLVDDGTLLIADGFRVVPVSHLWNAILAAWNTPAVLLCDRFRLAEVMDAVGEDCPIEPRVWRWSEATADIRHLRRLALDGIHGIALSVDPKSRALLSHSLAAAVVKTDDSGGTRLTKDGKNQLARDDVAASLLLAAGAAGRQLSAIESKPREKRRCVIVR